MTSPKLIGRRWIHLLVAASFVLSLSALILQFLPKHLGNCGNNFYQFQFSAVGGLLDPVSKLETKNYKHDLDDTIKNLMEKILPAVLGAFLAAITGYYTSRMDRRGAAIDAFAAQYG